MSTIKVFIWNFLHVTKVFFVTITKFHVDAFYMASCFNDGL
jgi:hypothetical protein